MSAAGLEWKERMESRKMYAAAEVPCCDEKEVHEDKVRFVNENMPAEDALYDLAELFKALGTPPGSAYCSRFSRRTSVSAIWRRHWG